MGTAPQVMCMSGIDVVIADNQPLSLSGIRSAVAEESDIRILAECEDTERLRDAVRHHAPHVLLVSADLFQESKEEFAALEELITECDETRVIVVTSRKDPEFLERALRCGAKG